MDTELSPEDVGAFTKMEFFIMPGAPAGVTFAAPTSISPVPGPSNDWISAIPNPEYSLLTGPQANSAMVTTYFSGPLSAKFGHRLRTLGWKLGCGEAGIPVARRLMGKPGWDHATKLKRGLRSGRL